MENSRLVRYIQDFGPKQREKFRQFVISPYFNQHQKTIELLEIILKEIDKSKPKLGKVNVHRRLFPKSDYDEQQLHNVMSYLKRLYYRFLSVHHFEQQNFREEVITLEAAYENNQFDVLKNRGKQLEKQLKRHGYRDSDYFQADYRLHKLLGYYMAHYEDRSKSHVFQNMLEKDVESLGPVQREDLYGFASNYCIRQINLGQDEFRRELFQLYKQGLRIGLIMQNGMLSEWNYKNITALGCSLKEYEWTENFIQEYKDMLPSHRRENAYNYNLAHLYYNKKQYSEALSVLLLVQFTDVKYHLNTSFLLLRTYFALKDTEALLSLIDTFRIYVIRNRKITTDQKRGYTNFLRFAKKLVLIRHQAPAYSRQTVEEKLVDLAKKVESTSNVINKYWILEECGVETGVKVG
ncbi:hypothetical protein [Flavilitoribacter nigricans]|uniref:Tetratricopeptide repeat protein n=1 Tax=Flavilitoribacter nigricans (strain ATCC 23147 / DSM 23189 / NBRC 102662 / NCIMB 1420 / SS-2) TaxID=1122177 RepID=A0A2D0NDZ7_FLAN2|nr:hypothetical protein [Flavilitoribacter nigricans]PHN06722.1 hypothetical protein CRP01_10530 [Flavilitoribacter nigricans DSM 23189 = NBRC 102662]